MELHMHCLHMSTLTPTPGTRDAQSNVVGSPYGLAPSLTTFNFVKLHLPMVPRLKRSGGALLFLLGSYMLPLAGARLASDHVSSKRPHTWWLVTSR